mgnify:FL=1
MFDTVNFQHRLAPVKNAGEPILSNAEFRERAAGKRFEKFVGLRSL